MTKEKLIEGILHRLEEKKRLYSEKGLKATSTTEKFIALGFELAYREAIVEVQCACLVDLEYKYKKES